MKPIIPAQGGARRLLKRLPDLLKQKTEVVQSGILTNGPKVAAFETALKAYLGAAEVFGVNSGSSALRAACELLQLPPGSEIIVPAYTFIMSAYAINDAFTFQKGTTTMEKGGLVLVFVDVDPYTYTIDPEKVRAAITEKTRAIMVVHMLGQMVAMRPILDLAEKYGLAVIEDAAQAIGATYHDPKTGTLWSAGTAGDFGAFSLSEVKNLGCDGGDAGALTISQRVLNSTPDLAERARAWRNTGRMTSGRYDHRVWGIRARMEEEAAAECLAELRLLPAWDTRRRAIAARYTTALAGSSWLHAPYTAPECEHAFFAYMVQPVDKQVRDDLVRRMQGANIEVEFTRFCGAGEQSD
jgi:dTDP-4-amino-4,6-dideoxygalactose transaminase